MGAAVSLHLHAARWTTWGTLGGPFFLASMVDPTNGCSTSLSTARLSCAPDVTWPDLVGPYARPLDAGDLSATAFVHGTRRVDDVGVLGLAAMLSTTS